MWGKRAALLCDAGWPGKEGGTCRRRVPDPDRDDDDIRRLAPGERKHGSRSVPRNGDPS